MLDTYIKDIKEKYVELGHQHSWTFLYTPKSTLHQKQKLLFLGLNPGGSEEYKGYKECPSCEEGNAYLIDQWDDTVPAGKSPLQQQIQKLYKEIYRHVPSLYTSHEAMMNATLAFNYVPFRSQSWNRLNNSEKTLTFCYDLLGKILEYVDPAVIITMDHRAYNAASTQYARIHPLLNRKTETDKINWGNAKYALDEYTDTNTRKLIVRLPHLSRYKIFSRDLCAAPREKIAAKIGQTLLSS